METIKINNTEIKIFATKFEAETPYTISPEVLNIFDKILLMPDTHIGKSVPIGFVAKYNDKIIPTIVGVDIGCGVMAYDIPKQDIDFAKFDQFIIDNIPSGFDVHLRERDVRHLQLDQLSFSPKNIRHIEKSLGTLGGGNHFIEICEGAEVYTIIVHSGSRNLGKQVCEYHERKLSFNKKAYNFDCQQIINQYKQEGCSDQIQDAIDNLKEENYKIDYLDGENLNQYLNDMRISQDFAYDNRLQMMKKLLEFFNIECDPEQIVDMPHNYIDLENKIIHKGSIKAMSGDKLVIPLNMRDGVVFATGKGNQEWLSSAPHGAGRKLSRAQARREVTLEQFKEEMTDVNTFSVNKSTIDESPFAYKDSNAVINDSLDSIEIVEVRRPIFNFKARD